MYTFYCLTHRKARIHTNYVFVITKNGYDLVQNLSFTPSYTFSWWEHVWPVWDQTTISEVKGGLALPCEPKPLLVILLLLGLRGSITSKYMCFRLTVKLSFWFICPCCCSDVTVYQQLLRWVPCSWNRYKLWTKHHITLLIQPLLWQKWYVKDMWKFCLHNSLWLSA